MAQDKKTPSIASQGAVMRRVLQYIGPARLAGRALAGAVSHQRRADAVCADSRRPRGGLHRRPERGGFRRPNPDSDDHRRLHRHRGGGAVGHERAAQQHHL